MHGMWTCLRAFVCVYVCVMLQKCCCHTYLTSSLIALDCMHILHTHTRTHTHAHAHTHTLTRARAHTNSHIMHALAHTQVASALSYLHKQGIVHGDL